MRVREKQILCKCAFVWARERERERERVFEIERRKLRDKAELRIEIVFKSCESGATRLTRTCF